MAVTNISMKFVDTVKAHVCEDLSILTYNQFKLFYENRNECDDDDMYGQFILLKNYCKTMRASKLTNG